MPQSPCMLEVVCALHLGTWVPRGWACGRNTLWPSVPLAKHFCPGLARSCLFQEVFWIPGLTLSSPDPHPFCMLPPLTAFAEGCRFKLGVGKWSCQGRETQVGGGPWPSEGPYLSPRSEKPRSLQLGPLSGLL